jgi:Putative transposase DNA-binding domain
MKKAITHLKLEQANKIKLLKLDELVTEHQRVVQSYCDWLIAKELREPDKYADIPVADVPTPLSDRWQRCDWQQACGIVQSWYSNERTTPPRLNSLCIQGNANVIKLEPSSTPTFDFWLRISTLNKRYPVRIPLSLYARARETLQHYPKLCTGVTLNKRKGHWFATLVVEKPGRKPPANRNVVAVDIGMVCMAATSDGEQYGQVSKELARRVERQAARSARKRKLNACLERKGLPTVSPSDRKAEAFARNEIGRALNQLVGHLPSGSPVALERLNVKDMRFPGQSARTGRSRQMNRRLQSSHLGYIRDKLKFKLDEWGIRYGSVQPAYTSQECSVCSFVDKDNRPSQAEFACLNCGQNENADVNAARNIAKVVSSVTKRFGDDELNQLSYHNVKAVLDARFRRRFSPGASSASAGLDTSPPKVFFGGGESYKKSISPV